MHGNRYYAGSNRMVCPTIRAPESVGQWYCNPLGKPFVPPLAEALSVDHHFTGEKPVLWATGTVEQHNREVIRTAKKVIPRETERGATEWTQMVKVMHSVLNSAHRDCIRSTISQMMMGRAPSTCHVKSDVCLTGRLGCLPAGRKACVRDGVGIMHARAGEVASRCALSGE